MVGQETGTGIDINKPFVQGLVYRNKRYLLLAEDIFQSFLLLMAVGKDKELETL